MKHKNISKVSLRSLELAKGIAVILILISNAFNFWISYDYNLRYIFGYFFLGIELFGASILIFLFSFSVAFTLKKKMGCKPKKVNRNKIFRKAIALIFFGILFNILSNPTLSYPLNLWGWNIIIFIGISQIICYFAFKLVRWARLFIGLLIIFLTPTVRELLFIGKDINYIIKFIHFILVSPLPRYSILPYASLCFFSTIFGELIFEAKNLESRIASINAMHSIIKYSLIFVFVGLIIPFLQSSPFITSLNYNGTKYPYLEGNPILEGYSFLYIPGMPSFLFKGSMSNLFLVSGISLLIFGISFFLTDIKNVKNKISSVFSFFAKYPVSLLFLQWLFLPIFYQILSIYLIFLFILGYVSFLALIFLVIQKYTNSILCFEWLIKKVAGNTKNEFL